MQRGSTENETTEFAGARRELGDEGTYPFSAAICEGTEVLVEEVGEARLVLHSDLVRRSLIQKRAGSTSGLTSQLCMATYSGSSDVEERARVLAVVQQRISDDPAVVLVRPSARRRKAERVAYKQTIRRSTFEEA